MDSPDGRFNLSTTEAHGGHSIDSQGPLPSDSYGSYCASDDLVARRIREKLREYRGMIISFLQEKLTLSFQQQLLTVQLITPGEADQVRKKQKRMQKASCLVDIISRKQGTDLKVFVHKLQTQCPKAHSMLFVPDYGQDVSSIGSSWESQRYSDESSVSTYSNSDRSSSSFNPQAQSNAARVSHPPRVITENLVHNIERGRRKATEKLEKCLHDTRFGLHVFLRELKSVLNSGVDIELVTFANGNGLMHEVIQLDRLDYLAALRYVGCWNKLYNLRTDSGPSGLTPTELAKKLKRSKIVTFLAEANSVETTLHDVDRCVRAGNVTLFRELKLMSRQYIVRSCRVVSDRASLLELACQSGLLPMLIEVIRTERDLGFQRDSIDKALALCIDLGHNLLLQPLMEYVPVNISMVTVDGKSLTERSAVNGDIETFRELERLGARPSDTIIALAAAQNRLPFLQEILTSSRSAYNINFQDRRKKSAVHFAAEKGNIEIVRLLLEKGIDLTLKDKRSFSILHSAVSGGSLLTVEAVLDACEQRHILRNMLTARDQYLGSERCFLVRGRDNEHPAWHYVEADRGRIDVFRRRTQGGAVDVAAYGKVLKSGWGTTPTPEIIQEIEGLYDVVNARTDAPLDQQPLHVAVIKNHEAVSLKLISIMDDVGQPDYFGLTPLHLAAMRGNVKVIKALLEKGANRTVTEGNGRTPLDIAEANDHHAAVTALTPAAQQDDTEVFRSKVLDLYKGLSKEMLDQCRQRGKNPKLYMKRLLRDMGADITDFLYDSLGEGPIAAETGMASGVQAEFF